MSDATSRRFYSRWARLYDAVADRSPVARLRTAVTDALAPPRGGTAVDLGCGTGATLPYLAERVGPAGRVVGVDASRGMLAAARRRARREGWRRVALVRGDATRPPACEADAALASFVSGMLADPGAAVREWARLVGPGGRVALLDFARSTGAGRPLNPAFAAFVRATSPPGTRSAASSPAGTLDERVADAHRALLSVCEPASLTHETLALGFARVSAGTVRDPDAPPVERR